MEKEIRCRDLDLNRECEFVARGRSEQEAFERISDHARAEHGIEIMTPDLVKEVRQRMRDAA